MSVEFQISLRRDAFEIEAACATDARVIALEGASGAGKTTILNGLAGLLGVRSARLAIDGRVLVDTASGIVPPPHRRRIGYVFQDLRLFPHLTVGANIGFGGRFADRPMSVDAALDLVDLNGFASRWPASLSGGEARRVAIARALCSAPQILFLDEPLTGLDLARRDSVMPYLRRLRDETLIPILLVSHDPRDLADLAEDRLQIGRTPMKPVRSLLTS